MPNVLMYFYIVFRLNLFRSHSSNCFISLFVILSISFLPVSLSLVASTMGATPFLVTCFVK